MDDTIGPTDFVPGRLMALSENTAPGQPLRAHNLLMEAWEWSASMITALPNVLLKLPAMTVDNCGNTYHYVGIFPNTPAVINTTDQNSSSDSFTVVAQTAVLGRLGFDGKWDWVDTINGGDLATIQSIAYDGCDNVLVSGLFGSTLVALRKGASALLFDPASIFVTSGTGVFIFKVRAEDGTPIWIAAVRSGRDTNSNLDEPQIASDLEGNTYVTFSANLETDKDSIQYFGGSPGTLFRQLQTNNPTGNEKSIAVAKLNPSGNWLWAALIQNEIGNISSENMAVDSCGNSYIIFSQENGNVNSPIIFFDKDGISRLQSLVGLVDPRFVIAKISSDGFWQWRSSVNITSGNDNPNLSSGISTDHRNNVYINYTVEAPALENNQFVDSNDAISPFQDPKADPGLQFTLFTGALDTDGFWIWHNTAGNLNGIPRVRTDSCGNSYVAALANGDVPLTNANQVLPTRTAVAPDLNRYFMAKIDPRGNWLWDTDLFNANGPIIFDGNTANDLAIDCFNNVYLSGTIPNGSPVFLNRDNVTTIPGANLSMNQLAIGKLSNEPNQQKTIGILQTIDGAGTMGTVQFCGTMPMPNVNLININGQLLTSGLEYFITESPNQQDMVARITTQNCDPFGCALRSIGTACADTTMEWNLSDPLCDPLESHACPEVNNLPIKQIRLSITAPQSIPSDTDQVVTWDTILSSHGLNFEGDTFNVPINGTGVYSFKTSLTYDPAINAAAAVGLSIDGNLPEYTSNAFIAPPTTGSPASDCSVLFLNAKSKVQIMTVQTTGSDQFLITPGGCFLEINQLK